MFVTSIYDAKTAQCLNNRLVGTPRLAGNTEAQQCGESRCVTQQKHLNQGNVTKSRSRGRQEDQLSWLNGGEGTHIWSMCHCWLDNDAKGSIKHEPDILENFLSCSCTFHTLTDLMPIRIEMTPISSKKAWKNSLRESCKLSPEEQHTKKPQHYCKSATTCLN